MRCNLLTQGMQERKEREKKWKKITFQGITGVNFLLSYNKARKLI